MTTPQREPTEKKIILKEQTAETITLKLKGPTTFDEGKTLAAELNAVIASYNTLYFMNEDGSLQDPRISAKTGQAS